LIHQTNHWRAKGDPFYGDHLMYERLYSTTQDHVDKVAEKAVGIGYDTGVDAVLQTKHIQRVVAKYCHTATYDEKELVKCSLAVENGLLMVINELVSMMNASGMSMGVDNLLAQIYDDHENLIYLLKRRLG
jgi:DNA-binding ferritin-like protein